MMGLFKKTNNKSRPSSELSKIPHVNIGDIPNYSRLLEVIFPETIQKIIGRYDRHYLSNGTDGFVYLGQTRIGYAPINELYSEYWGIRDVQDPNNEWQIWYFIPYNLNNQPEFGLSTILDHKSFENIEKYMEFYLDLN